MQGIQKQARADLNLLWASLIIEELSRLGVEHVCMAPGSRSTPLTLACAANNKLTKHCHFDERGLGFMALGLAKASNTPVAIITTSGTAVANLYPAIIEASLTRVPLIILSADRPPELLDCGANQAIAQVGMFAQYAKQLSLPVPDLHLTPTALLSSLDQALADTQI
jgi:2-succinyl-5-enolpyruvyl-6-hydroxy-3-cyclohexene-1-carboxylate synthase